jgi:hypothetical protein
MKIRICENIPFLLLLISTSWAQAQITSPVIRGKFGVDADVQNNWFNNGALAGNDDWYFRNGSVGSSVFMIDTTGAAAITTQYASGIGLTTPFFRKMNYPVHTKLDGTKTLMDAMFVRDYHNVDSTVFALGSNKNGMSPASWGCPDYNSVPDKNDILDAYVHIRREGPTLSIADTLWMFGAVALESNNGNRYFDFELYQTDILFTRGTHSFTGYGPDAGHTSWQFDASGNLARVGDIIFSAEYGGSGLSSIEARIWIDKASLSIVPASFDWTGTFDGAHSSSQFGYAGIQPKTGDPFYFGTDNSATTWAGPFKLVRANNSVVTSFETNQFMEFGVNLTVLGLNPATLMGVNSCSLPFSKILVKTRSSSSFSAELKDFVGPLDLFLPPLATAAADIPMYCGAIGISQLDVVNPYITSVYTWTTGNGHIVGASTGPSIVVDQPGTYIVTQALESGCPTYATDTVVITHDPLCTVLANNEMTFKGTLTNNHVQLNWSVMKNQEIQHFTVERSIDGVRFTLLDTINSNSYTPRYAAYSLLDDVQALRTSYVYYRIRLSAHNGGAKYSKVVKVALNDNTATGISLQQNPVRDQMQINIHSMFAREVQVLIYDITGRLLKRLNTQVQQGYSSVSIYDFRNWTKGVYTVKVLAGKDVFIDRMILVK